MGRGVFDFGWGGGLSVQVYFGATSEWDLIYRSNENSSRMLVFGDAHGPYSLSE